METKELATKLAFEVLDNFSTHTRRVCAMFGGNDAVEKVIIPEVRAAAGIALSTGNKAVTATDPSYTGERRNLEKLLAGASWLDTMFKVKKICDAGNCHVIRQGDYVVLPVHVPEVEIDGVTFDAIDIDATELIVLHVRDGHAYFNFEDVLGFAAMNAKNTNEGGIENTAMSKYLNGVFLEKVFPGLADVMQKTESGLRVTLPTEYEIFGESDNKGIKFNWPDTCPVQFDYFLKYKNRIKVKDDDTKWWWTATAAYSTGFAYVDYHGYAYNGGASGTGGGVSPLLSI